jgi:6-phosphogluconolactonase
MTGLPSSRVEVLANPEALAGRVANWLLGLAAAKEGTFSISLSGGSTPRQLYQLLAQAPYRDAFPWKRTHLFWGDERFVPYDDDQSNYRMVREALLDYAPIPAENIHPVPTEHTTPDGAADAYQRTLQSFYGADDLVADRPVFDVMLLGLGPDGHTASLFPGTATLAVRDRWVAAVVGAKAKARITLTYPALESSRHVAFLVAGDDKQAIYHRVRANDDSLPAARLRPSGDLTWFVDRAAAGVKV